MLKKIESQMHQFAKNLEFEKAIALREEMIEIKKNLTEKEKPVSFMEKIETKVKRTKQNRF
jgi:excinuclease UvrABC nuclease subunit